MLTDKHKISSEDFNRAHAILLRGALASSLAFQIRFAKIGYETWKNYHVCTGKKCRHAHREQRRYAGYVSGLKRALAAFQNPASSTPSGTDSLSERAKLAKKDQNGR